MLRSRRLASALWDPDGTALPSKASITLGPAKPKSVPEVARMRSALGTALAETPPHTLPSSTAIWGRSTLSL